MNVVSMLLLILSCLIFQYSYGAGTFSCADLFQATKLHKHERQELLSIPNIRTQHSSTFEYYAAKRRAESMLLAALSPGKWERVGDEDSLGTVIIDPWPLLGKVIAAVRTDALQGMVNILAGKVTKIESVPDAGMMAYWQVTILTIEGEISFGLSGSCQVHAYKDSK